MRRANSSPPSRRREEAPPRGHHFEPLGENQQQPVADVVSESVVDVVEVIDVDQRHREPAVFLLGFGQPARELVAKAVAVRQPGEIVEESELFDRRFALAHRALHAGELARQISDLAFLVDGKLRGVLAGRDAPRRLSRLRIGTGDAPRQEPGAGDRQQRGTERDPGETPDQLPRIETHRLGRAIQDGRDPVRELHGEREVLRAGEIPRVDRLRGREPRSAQGLEGLGVVGGGEDAKRLAAVPLLPAHQGDLEPRQPLQVARPVVSPRRSPRTSQSVGRGALTGT